LSDSRSGASAGSRVSGQRDPEQHDPAARRQSPAENDFAEILVEREKDPLLLRAESGNVFIRDAGAFFSDREDVPPRLTQGFQSRPREILVGQDSHVVLRE
jgi:hypothetical protein